MRLRSGASFLIGRRRTSKLLFRRIEVHGDVAGLAGLARRGAARAARERAAFGVFCLAQAAVNVLVVAVGWALLFCPVQ